MFSAGIRMQDFRKLRVWQKSLRLSIDVQRVIDSGPKWKYPKTRNQTLRAAASIADTIAEGCGKPSPLELARYCDMASGSAHELLNHLLRARAIGCLSHEKFKEFEARIEEIRRMLWSLAASVRRKYGRKPPKKRGKPKREPNESSQRPEEQKEP